MLELIAHVQFDTIYHEHFSYLSLVALERIFAASELRVFDVERLPTHGGSLRLFVCHANASYGNTTALSAARAAETAAGLDRADGAAYAALAPRAEAARASFLTFLAHAAAEGRTVAGYRAAAKGNTFLNYCGVTARQVPRAPDDLRRAPPDYVVILPWNLAAEITSSLAELRARGTRFVTAIPLTTVLP